MSRLWFFLLLAAGLGNYLCSLLILRTMARSGAAVGRFEMRHQVHKNLRAYRQLTLKRDGRVGLPWYGYYLSLLLLLVAMVFLLLRF